MRNKWINILLFIISNSVTCFGYESERKIYSESQIEHFVTELKKLIPGKSITDEVSEHIGQPNQKNKENEYEEWKYNLYIISNKNIQRLQLIKIQNQQATAQLAAVSEKRKQYSDEASKLLYASGSSRNVSYLFNMSALEQDKVNKVSGEINSLKAKKGFIEQDIESESKNATCILKFNRNGILIFIDMNKIEASGTQLIYHKDNSDHVNSGEKLSPDLQIKNDSIQKLVVLDEQPSTPTEGQIYFNNTDKHAYLWNGVEWRQLDK